MTAVPALELVDDRHVGRALGRLGWPIAASIASDQLLGVVDTIAIGSLGTKPLAAVAAATTLFAVLVFVMHGFTSGMGILGAQAVGENDGERFGRLVRASSLLPIAIGAFFAAVATAFGGAIMQAYVGGLGIAHLAAPYFALRCISLIPIAIGGIAYTAFGAAGKTGFGFRLLIVINAVHIPLLFVLALGLGTHRPLGVFGAGASSLIAETVGAAYTIYAFARMPQFRVFARAEIDLRLAWRIAVLSAPESVYLFLVVVPDIVIVTFLAPLGATAVAAFRVLSLVSDVTFAVPASLSSASQTVIGQQFGAGNADGAERFDRRARRYGVGISTLCGGLVALLAWPISALVTLNPLLAAVAAGPLAVHMLTLPLKGYAMLGLAPIRAAGDTRFSMLVGVAASISVIPALALAILVWHIGLYAVPFAWLVGWTVWCTLTYVRLRRYDWARGRIAA